MVPAKCDSNSQHKNTGKATASTGSAPWLATFFPGLHEQSDAGGEGRRCISARLTASRASVGKVSSLQLAKSCVSRSCRLACLRHADGQQQ